MIKGLDEKRFQAACGWFTTLPNYMFTSELSAALLTFAYQQPEIDQVDRAVRMVLTYQGSLLEPLSPVDFLAFAEQCYFGSVPGPIHDFLDRETTH